MVDLLVGERSSGVEDGCRLDSTASSCCAEAFGSGFCPFCNNRRLQFTHRQRNESKETMGPEEVSLAEQNSALAARAIANQTGLRGDSRNSPSFTPCPMPLAQEDPGGMVFCSALFCCRHTAF